MPTPSRKTLGLSVPVIEALDPAKWRERYAFGVVLGQGSRPTETGPVDRILGCAPGRHAKTAGGIAAQTDVVTVGDLEIPDDVIRWHLRAALSELEVKLGMPLGVVVVKSDPVDDGLVLGTHYDRRDPRRPFVAFDAARHLRIDLPAGVLSIERIRAYWFGQLVWTVSSAEGNSSLIKLEHPNAASLHLLPSHGVTLSLAAPATGQVYGAVQMMYGYPEHLPDVWSVDYTLGPTTKYGEQGMIEAVLAHWVYAKAGILLLSIGGMAASRGLTSASLSIDGLSKSVGLQASAMYGINSALENRLKEAEEAIDWKALQLYKKGLRLRAYG